MHNLHICIPPSSQPVPQSKFKKAFLFQPSAWLVFPCVQRYLQTETVSSILRRTITNKHHIRHARISSPLEAYNILGDRQNHQAQYSREPDL